MQDASEGDGRGEKVECSPEAKSGRTGAGISGGKSTREASWRVPRKGFFLFLGFGGYFFNFFNFILGGGGEGLGGKIEMGKTKMGNGYHPETSFSLLKQSVG